jgi:hypothetical protein
MAAAALTIVLQLIFIGEHTSYTHAWIASALESGIRGSVQLLLGRFSVTDVQLDSTIAS